MPRYYYCQNTYQSGDTTGMGLALLLKPDYHLLFLVNYDQLKRALPFLHFYYSLGIKKKRIWVVICDSDARDRKTRRGAKKDSGFLKSLLNSKKYDYRIMNRISPYDGNTKAEKQANKALEARDRLLSDMLKKHKSQQDKRMIAGSTSEKDVVRRKLYQYSGKVAAWTDPFSVLGCNQVYQVISNPDKDPPPNYQSFFSTALNRFLPIGQSTQDIKSLILREKSTKAIKVIHKAFGRCEIPGVVKFVDEFLTKILGAKGSLLKRAKGARNPNAPMVVLIWVRGLSGSERLSFRHMSIDSGDINDEMLRQIDGYKRNPHHVTTVQLYASIIHLLKDLTKTTGRRYIGIPIGDPILYDQYGSVEEQNLYKKASSTNLIQFFTRCPEFRHVVGDTHFPNRFN